MDNLTELSELTAGLLQLFALYNRNFALQFTYAFRPVLSVYEAIFQTETARKLFLAYETEFWSNPELCILETGNPNRTQVIVSGISTKMLIGGDTFALNTVPGGYSEVIPHYRTDIDIPIMKVSFVEPGHSYGMEYDGFYFLNERLIWIPKPWRII